MRKLILAVVLTLPLGTSALAGIIQCPPAPEPPPPDSQTANGIITTPPQSETQPTDPTIELALIVLQSLLATL